MKKHLATILRPSFDCTNNGLTGTRFGLTRVWLLDPDTEGDADLSDLVGTRVLVVDHRQGKNHPCLTPRAVPGTVDANKAIVLDQGWSMAGGNRVAAESSDFSSVFGDTLPVHDRFE